MSYNKIIPFYRQIDKYIVKGRGCYLYDEDNKKYLDFEAGDWAAFLGHSNKHIKKVIKKQAGKLIHDGLRFRNHESEILSGLLLEKLSLENGKCVFLNSGSEAVNCALRIAKHLTGRNKILKIDCTYLAAYGHGHISEDNHDLINVQLDNLDSVRKIDYNDIAAFAFEPGNSWSMIKYPSCDFVKTLANKTKENGGLLIANEVTTGFGRTGKWFGFQHYEFIPDIVALGKSIGNGYPLSSVAISQSVSEMFDKSPFRYAQSHQNDPLGCAVGIEVIRLMEKNNLVNRSNKTGVYFNEQLYMLQRKHPAIIKEIRARGLMIGVELDTAKHAEDVYLKLMDNGFILGYKENVLRFLPPVIIQKKHIDKLTETIDKIILDII